MASGHAESPLFELNDRSKGRTFGLRQFLNGVRETGELEEVSGAHWDKEMSAISHMICGRGRDPVPALLFDDIPDYPSGHRNLFGQTNSMNRAALAYDMEPDYTEPMEFIEDYRDQSKRMEQLDGLDPEFVAASDAPLLDNRQTGDDVDLLSMPVPLHHELDGGRFIGTADTLITRDPTTERVNLGVYRMQVLDEDRAGVYIVEGKHGWLDIQNHFEKRDEPMPIAATFGQDPTLFIFASIGLRHEHEYGEYAHAGAIKGESFPIVEGPVTGLPLPANAEIAIEGWLHPGDEQIEGPFGEWAGYYGREAEPEPAVEVEALYHQDDPILTSAVPAKPPYDYSYHKSLTRSANLWDQLEAAGIPNVTGVWRTEAGGSRLFNVVRIEQQYPGHARQAGYVAAHCRAGGQSNRWTVVVDDDIDLTDLTEVAWAMSTRCLPKRDIEILGRGWAHKSVPEVEESNPLNSRAIVDACIPYEKIDTFAPVAESSDALEEAVMEDWYELVTGESRE